MNTLFVMIKTDLGRTNEVGDAIVNRGGEAVEVYSITGEYDLLVKARFREIDQVAAFVHEQLHPMPGVRETHTVVSFQRYGDFTV